MNQSRAPIRDRGFSLVELLVVVVVLGVLATVVVFALRGATSDGQDAAYVGDERALRNAEEAYKAQYGQYGSESDLVDGGFVRSESQLHDVTLDAEDGYLITRVDASSATEAASGSTDASSMSDVVDPTPEGTSPMSGVTTTISGESASGSGSSGESAPGSGSSGSNTATTTTATPVTIAPVTIAPVTTPMSPPVTNSGVTCSLTVNETWPAGGNAQLTIVNNSAARITNWTVQIARAGYGIGLWNAADQVTAGSTFTARNASWNGTVNSGASVVVTGGPISGAGLVIGQNFGCELVTPVVSLTDVTCSFTMTQVWPSGGNGVLAISNTASIPISGWTVKITGGTATISLSGVVAIESDSASVTVGDGGWNGNVGSSSTTKPSTGAVRGSNLVVGQTFPCAVVAIG